MPSQTPTPTPFPTPGGGSLGEFDASQEDDPALQGRVWRSYSVVDLSANGDWLVSTRLALSDDHGSAFTDVMLINQATQFGTAYAWNHEVSSLVYDPSDPDPNAVWKLIWHRYLINPAVPGDHHDFANGWLALRTAPLPTGPWSQELKLLAGIAYDPNNSFSPGMPSYPLPAAMSDCIAVSEPGGLKAADGFYLTLLGQTSSGPTVRLLKLRHTAGATVMENKGTLLSVSDAALVAAAYGSTVPELASVTGFSAPDLVEVGGNTYLLASAVDASSQYRGCAVFQVADLGTASLTRLANNCPQLAKWISGISGTFRGACTYSQGSSGSGVVLSQLSLGATKSFTLVNTLIQIP